MTEAGAVLVTGAAGGIGSAVTRLLAERGHRVYAGIHAAPGDLVEWPGVTVLPLDVTDEQSVAAAAAEVARREGGLHAIVNNAGVIVQGPIELVPAAELRRQLAVNVEGPAAVIRAFLPLLRSGNGRIVNVSAPTGRLALPFLGALSASKASLESITTAIRTELAPWRIPVSLVIPGSVQTTIFTTAQQAERAAHAGSDPQLVASYRDQLDAVAAAAARFKAAPPEHVAETIVRAVTAGRPKRRYVSGSDARMFLLLARLPSGLRDRLVARGFGLHRISTPR